MKASIAIAQKEFKDGLRNRWLVAITVIFAVFASGLSWFGSASVGTIGFSSVANTIVSLSSLNVFLLPLIALLLSYNAIVGEDEDGTLLLLLTYPLTRGELLLGKLMGHTAILAISTIAGFGSAGLIIAFFADAVDVSELLSAFGLFIASAILLGMIFISLSYLVSSWVSEKSKAAGLALIIWFFFVLIYDMGLLGILVATEGQVQAEVFPYLLLFNPTDIFRLVNLVGFDSNGTGLLSIASEQSFTLTELFVSMTIWIIVPFTLAYYRLTKRPI
ncbi:ABC transporter permease subunit [Aliikangiella sp. G2MR2-5]|uniref:ABC transporter permease subunit n=1 Tax=Aliikangiella sp. G2MR2-5 TaxID=2788943 RepID=UPI0018AA3410|nr:ABC transporter permease subunit [Aliikangiella sp. G2MR2-5]